MPTYPDFQHAGRFVAPRFAGVMIRGFAEESGDEYEKIVIKAVNYQRTRSR